MSKYKGKKVLVVGLGVTGVSVARYMTKQGAKVIVTDTKQRNELAEHVNACAELKVELELGKHNAKTFTSVDLIVMSPGVPPTLKALEEARQAGIPITNEIDLAVAAIKEPIIAITGTNGKTTTTTLIGELLRAIGRKVFVGGNIGTPLLDYVMSGEKVDYVVAELSSFQLELTEKFSPAVAVFTNMEPDHQDRYPDYDAYVAAKKRLLKLCSKNSFVVLNYDNPTVSQFNLECPGKMIWFTKKDPIEVGGQFAESFVGCYANGPARKLVEKWNGSEEVYDLTGFKLLGEHNRENLMAAICATRALGVRPEAVRTVIQNFRGLPHRMEFVRKKDGVYFVNDSKGTNVMSVQRALASFPTNPVILICGGKDKGGDFAPLQDLVKSKCKILVLVGEAKEKINRALGDFAETYLVGTFDEAVLLSFQKSRTGDVVVLSPGCASFDMFRNYEERGEYFKKLVNQL